MRRWIAVLPLGLSGCPYLFDPPDLSNVAHGPSVVDFEVVPRMDSVVAHFALADSDGDLVGGSVDLSDGTRHWVLNIPGDIDEWDPLGTSTATLYFGSWLDCTTSIDQPWTLAPTDLAGNVGEAASFELVVPALGLESEAPGPDVWPTSGYIVPNAPPYTGCVGWETDPTDTVDEPLKQLRHDYEGVFVTVSEGRDYRVQLWWNTPCDADIFVYPYPLIDVDLDHYWDTIATSLQTGDVPEEATFPMAQGGQVYADFAFYRPLQGQTSPFQGQFLVTPE